MFFIDFNQPVQDDPTISVGAAFDEIAAMDHYVKIFEDENKTPFVQTRDQILLSLMRTSLRGTVIHYENNFIRFYNTRNNTKHDAYRVMAVLKDKYIPFAIHKSNGLLSIYIPPYHFTVAMNSVLDIDDALKTSVWTEPMKPCEMQYNGGHVITLNLRYTIPNEDGTMYVAAHPESYWKSIGFLAAIAEHLKSIIPFEFVQVSEPEIEVLGGTRYRRIPSVQFRILSKAPADIAIASLNKIGFYEGLEPVL